MLAKSVVSVGTIAGGADAVKGTGWIKSVLAALALADAVAAQHDAACARRLAADHAEDGFDIVVADRGVGQEGGGAGDENCAATVHEVQ